MLGSPRVLLLLLALAAACGGATCPATAGPVGPARPFLWTVTGDGGARVYLYGTFHAAGAADVPRAALDALGASPVFVGEVDDLPRDAVRAAATLPRGQSLQTLLGDDAWYDLRDALAAVLIDEELRRVRPWYALSLLTAASAGLPRVSMDEALRGRARAQGAAVEFLERPDEQLALLGESVDVAALRQALAERRTMRCTVDRLRSAYRAGDATPLRDEIGDDQADALLLSRNRRWADAIERHVRGRGAFVAVGVSHLVGDGSLPELLAARGLRVTRAP